MCGWQAVASLLFLGRLLAGEAQVGEAGLQALAESRAKVQAVGGSGLRTVGRQGEADGESEVRRATFQMASDGRYFLKLVLRDEPDGERDVWISDGVSTWIFSAMDAQDMPRPKLVRDGDNLFRRLLACVRLDLASLRKDYAIELKAGPAAGQRILTFQPTDMALKQDITLVTVTIDDAGHPMRVVLDEANGTRETVVLDAFQDDPPLDPASFTVKR